MTIEAANPPDTAELSWSALRNQDEEALRLAELEAFEIARSLAIESLASDREAELAELAERRLHLARAAWPENPLEGYRLQSSLGAFVVARIAVSWVPSGQTGLRRTPLRPEGVIRALIQHGVESVVARSVVGNWEGSEEGFKGDPEGLDAGLLAGLAERSLTSAERHEALSQISVSTRDLARLGTTLLLGRAVRRLLPVLANEQLGDGFVAALALISTNRAERAAELLMGGDPESTPPEGLRLRTALELASALVHLGSGRAYTLEPDHWAPAVHAANTSESQGTLPTRDIGSSEDGASDAEDIFEIVEEEIDPAAALVPWEGTAQPELPLWWPSREAHESAGQAFADLAEHRSMARQRGGALGFSAAFMDRRGAPIPPDPRLAMTADDAANTAATERLDLADLATAPRVEGSPAEPFLPPTRAALRAILAAAEGHGPETDAVDQARGLHWVFCRCAALADLVDGNLEGALAHLDKLDPDQAPERRWIRDRKLRYEGRQAEALSPKEARVAAAPLALDLARSLARTLTGAFAEKGTEDEDRWPTSSEG